MLNKAQFANNPTRLDISRSKFDLSWRNTFTTRAGICQIIYNEEILPGDTFDVSGSFVIRSSTPVAPVMDDLYADIYFFFVPNKMTLSRAMLSPTTTDTQASWKAFIGAQDSLLNVPTPASGIRLPQVNVSGTSSVTKENYLNSLGDMLGLPQAAADYKVNCLEALAYVCIWNNWFRDPNGGMNPITLSVSSGNAYFNGYSQYGYTDTIDLASMKALPSCRMNGGYFTSALPWPQRNSTSVLLPLGDKAPLSVGSGYYDISNVRFYTTIGTPITSGSLGISNNYLYAGGTQSATSKVNFTNLAADLSKATAASVNSFRYAVQLQRWYEALARGGNSYGNEKQATFGVTGHDILDDRPEYLGGKRVRLDVSQVNNTAGDLGDTGAFSLTTDKHHYFTKSFDDWGTIMGIMVIRPKESYCQGVARKFSRFDKFQFYWPQFANIGEQEILKKEIMVTGSSGSDNSVFGYQEAFAEYRYHPDQVCGLMRPTYGNPATAAYTYCNNFSTVPTLAAFINGDSLSSNVDQTLKVSLATGHYQFFGQFYWNVSAVRPMPTYSIPGLVDHH